MHSKNTNTSFSNVGRKELTKIKGLIPKTPIDCYDKFKKKQQKLIDNCSIKTTYIKIEEEKRHLNNSNSSMVSNGKEEYIREKALKDQGPNGKSVERQIKKITPNMTGRSTSNLKNESFKGLKLKKEINGKEDEFSKIIEIDNKQSILSDYEKKYLQKNNSFIKTYNLDIKKGFRVKNRLEPKKKNLNKSHSKCDNHFENNKNKDFSGNSKTRNLSAKNLSDWKKDILIDSDLQTPSRPENTADNNNTFIAKEIQLTINAEKDCPRSLFLEKSFDKSFEKDLKLLSTYERFKNNQQISIAKKQASKRKIEKTELHETQNKSEINKHPKQYKKSNEPGFLRRLEIYKFISFAKKIELTNKLKQEEDPEFNRNAKPKAKITLPQIEKIFSEKLNNEKIKRLEKERKFSLIKKEQEKNQLLECTFKPQISKRSRELDVSERRQKYDLSRPKSVSDLTEKPKYYRLEGLNPTSTMHNLLYYIKFNHGKVKSQDGSEILCRSNDISDKIINLTCNQGYKSFENNDRKNRGTDNNLDFSLIKDNVCLTFNHNERGKDELNRSSNKKKNDKDNYLSFGTKMDKDRRCNVVPISTQNEFANSDINISQRESDILRELLLKKLNG